MNEKMIEEEKADEINFLKNAGMEKLLQIYLETAQTIEDLEASISVIKDEMILRLDAENIKGKVVGDYSITKVTRTNFRPTLQQAKELTATKIVEQIDTVALKNLYTQGVEIPNTTTTSFVMVKPLEKAN